jgi:hypothetical protein
MEQTQSRGGQREADQQINRDPVDNPTPKKIPPFYTKNPYFRSIISKQLLVGIIYLSKVALEVVKI